MGILSESTIRLKHYAIKTKKPFGILCITNFITIIQIETFLGLNFLNFPNFLL